MSKVFGLEPAVVDDGAGCSGSLAAGAAEPEAPKEEATCPSSCRCRLASGASACGDRAFGGDGFIVVVGDVVLADVGLVLRPSRDRNLNWGVMRRHACYSLRYGAKQISSDFRSGCTWCCWRLELFSPPSVPVSHTTILTRTSRSILPAPISSRVTLAW